MKKILSFVLLFVFLAAPVAFAQTNTNQTVLEQVKDGAKQVVATNINQVMVQILSGVKDASGEVYGASKVAVGQAYDFVKKETPEVITEFIRWNIIQAVIYIGMFMAMAGLLIAVSRVFRKGSEKLVKSNGELSDGGMACAIFRWVTLVVACSFLVGSITYNGLTIGKCIGAPRVFIIEYVVDTINQIHNGGNR